MFGYVKASKEQLGEEDYKIYCSYYCGLCKALGKYCSQMSRLGLSYDMSFLALLLSSVLDEEEQCKDEKCIAHPIKSRLCIKNSKALEYSAKMSALLSYEKCIDDWHDDKSIKAVLGMMMYFRAYQKTYKSYRETTSYIKEKLSELGDIEKNNIRDIDEAADKFALILSKLFTPGFIENENTKKQLEWLGYNLGRWIYITDAINDMKSDYKTGSYNALLKEEIKNIDEYCKAVCEKSEMTLTFTLENIASTFDLITFNKNKDLLEKIIYISLPQMQKQILNNIGGKNESL